MSTSTGPEAARGIIGKVATLTLEQARGIAEGMSHRVKAGGDPLEDKQAARDALTVARLLDSYTASPRYAEKGPATQRTGIGQINRHLKPPLGKRHVARLEQDDIRRAFAADRDGATATRIPSPSTTSEGNQMQNPAFFAFCRGGCLQMQMPRAIQRGW